MALARSPSVNEEVFFVLLPKFDFKKLKENGSGEKYFAKSNSDISTH